MLLWWSRGYGEWGRKKREAPNGRNNSKKKMLISLIWSCECVLSDPTVPDRLVQSVHNNQHSKMGWTLSYTPEISNRSSIILICWASSRVAGLPETPSHTLFHLNTWGEIINLVITHPLHVLSCHSMPHEYIQLDCNERKVSGVIHSHCRFCAL